MALNRKWYNAAAKFYEKAGFARGTKVDREILADVYEKAGEGGKAVQLRKKIEREKKKK